MAQRRSLGEQALHVLDPRMALGESKYRWERDEHGKWVRVSNGEDKIHSLGTKRNYASSLVQLGKFMAEQVKKGEATKQGSYLHRLKPEDVSKWLEKRSHEVGRTQLNIDRRACEVAYQVKITPLKSDLTHDLKSRAYTVEQVQMVARCQQERNSLSTQLAYRCGLRAHELYTLARPAEQPRSNRRGWRDDRFGDRLKDGVIYTVRGKGGLVREVVVPRDLAERLEARRLEAPRHCYEAPIGTTERIHYVQRYDIGAGNAWSKSFGDASERALGWSNGGHGLRHTYAQERMNEEQQAGRAWDEALEVVSQELGHFRESITLVYLR